MRILLSTVHGPVLSLATWGSLAEAGLNVKRLPRKLVFRPTERQLC